MTYGTADEALLAVLVMFKKMSHVLWLKVAHLVFWQNKYCYQTGTSLIEKQLLLR